MEKSKRLLFDLHCHFLPGIDDGCKTCEESASVLSASREQGVCGIVATPHYYPKETVNHFLQRRQASFEKLSGYLFEKKTVCPEICLGAEVAYHSGLIHEEQLQQLCIGQSNYLLLELPFVRWTPNLLRDLQAFQSVRGVTPILAHLERYFSLQDKKMMSAVMDSPVLIQMNGEAVLDFWGLQKRKQQIKQGFVHVMGSDSHNRTSRPPNLGMAVQRLERAGVGSYVDQICRLSSEIFQLGMGKRV